MSWRTPRTLAGYFEWRSTPEWVGFIQDPLPETSMKLNVLFVDKSGGGQAKAA